MARDALNIHERFLRHIWSNQYLRHTSLQTTDGKPVRVLDAGAPNADGGPDFRGALVRIGSTVYAGDVEIHRNAVEWIRHEHQNDPRYNKVILHVVLEGVDPGQPTLVRSGRMVPLLVLEPFLSESIRTLWQKTILDERARRMETIKCFRVNAGIGPELLTPWLRRLAVERLELKLRRFDERLKELAQLSLIEAREPYHTYGVRRIQGDPDDIPPPHRELTQKDLSRKGLWEQVLYEGLLEGLGYSKNREPFVRLARSATLARISDLGIETEPKKIEALLFGASGLLPKLRDLREKESREYVRALIDGWKTLKRSYRSTVLHPAEWQFFPTRPSNFPTLRLAAAAGLAQKLLRDDLFRKIIQVIKFGGSSAGTIGELKRLLSVGTSAFWSRHYHFDRAANRPVRSLGTDRVNDMIVNTTIPVALLYARTFKDRLVRERTLILYETFPPLTENSVTRLMERQLLKGRLRLNGVGLQQGVLQLFKYYCREERCSECEIGKVVFSEKKCFSKERYNR